MKVFQLRMIVPDVIYKLSNHIDEVSVLNTVYRDLIYAFGEAVLEKYDLFVTADLMRDVLNRSYDVDRAKDEEFMHYMKALRDAVEDEGTVLVDSAYYDMAEYLTPDRIGSKVSAVKVLLNLGDALHKATGKERPTLQQLKSVWEQFHGVSPSCLTSQLCAAKDET